MRLIPVASGCGTRQLLDLAGMVVPFGVRFDQCEFDSPVIVEGAQLYELALTRCDRLPGLLANGARISRDLDLSGTRITGTQWTNVSTSKRAAVWLCEADIGDRLGLRRHGHPR